MLAVPTSEALMSTERVRVESNVITCAVRQQPLWGVTAGKSTAVLCERVEMTHAEQRLILLDPSAVQQVRILRHDDTYEHATEVNDQIPRVKTLHESKDGTKKYV